MNQRALPLVLVIMGVLFASLVATNGDLAWMAVPFLAYLTLGVLLSPAARGIQLQASRSAEKASVDGKQAVKVSVTVSNAGVDLDRLCLSDVLPSGTTVVDGQNRVVVALPAGQAVELGYTILAERGDFIWESVLAVVSDPLGLIEARLPLPAAAQVQLLPKLTKFRPFPVRSQRTLHSAGSIPARRGGSGTDFWGVREYQPGDPLRRLDWRLTARHPHKFFTKEFEQEEIADIGLILDARRKTDLRLEDDSLFEHSLRATASLADVFLRQGNRVSLLIYADHITSVFPGYGKAQLNQIMRTLARATTESDGSLDGLQFIPVQMFASHALIVILSPLAPNDWQLFPRLRAYGYQVLLISPDPFGFARGALPSDPATRLAYRLARLERQLEISKITRLWIPVIDWQVSQPLSPLVRNALRGARIRREP
jgi:uncharacterized protein (DUF58 family)